MSGATVRGYAARAAGLTLEPFSYARPHLRQTEVRVAVDRCGVCYTDVHAIDDHFGVFSFPMMPGHEIVGRVEEVGADVPGLQEGDLVGVGWQGRSCGECEWCRADEDHLCRDIAECGTWTPFGGFSSEVVVDGRFAYPLPAGMAPEEAAVLMCAGIAVYAPLRRQATGPSSRVGIIGIGGLGHLAIQFAHALGYEVTALSSSPEKGDEARSFGAHDFLVSTDRAAMEQAEYGFDLLVCTSHGELDWGSLLMALKKNGRMVLPAFPPVELGVGGSGHASGPAVDLVVHQLSITGSFLGNRNDMQDMLAFAREHRITPKIETMPMSQVNEAILRVRNNRARYRVVLVNG